MSHLPVMRLLQRFETSSFATEFVSDSTRLRHNWVQFHQQGIFNGIGIVCWAGRHVAKPKTSIECMCGLVRSPQFEYGAPRPLCQACLQSPQDQGRGDTLVPHRLDDRKVHQPYFLEDNPETEISNNRDGANSSWRHLPCRQKMCKGIAAQFRYYHFARPGGREASFFDLQNVRQRLDGRLFDVP